MRFLSKFSGSAFILALMNNKFHLAAVSSSCPSLSSIIDECAPSTGEEPVGFIDGLQLARQEFSTSFVFFNPQSTHSCVLRAPFPYVSLKQ